MFLAIVWIQFHAKNCSTYIYHGDICVMNQLPECIIPCTPGAQVCLCVSARKLEIFRVKVIPQDGQAAKMTSFVCTKQRGPRGHIKHEPSLRPKLFRNKAVNTFIWIFWPQC